MQHLRFIQKLTCRKIANILSVWISYKLSNFTKKVVVFGNAFHLSIEPSSFCNLKCVECPTGNETLTRNKSFLKFDLFKKIIDENKKTLSYLMLYFQGEPFMNKDIYEMISYANEQNIFTMTSTNGHFLSKENAQKIVQSKLDKIIISIDGTTQEVYEKYRKGGSLNTVLEGITNLVEAKKNQKTKFPFIELQFLVLKSNEHQIAEIKQLAKDLKVDKLNFKSAQIYDYQNNSELITSIEKYARYRKNSNGILEFKNKIVNKCWRLWSSAVVTSNGDLVACCYDKDANFKFGNLKTEKLSNIWKNFNYTKFRKQILTSKNEIEMCKDCIL